MRSKRELGIGAACIAMLAFSMGPALAQETPSVEVGSRIVAVAQKDARDLLAPTVPLNTYEVIEIAPMSLSEPVRADPRKVAKAQEFETRFNLYMRDTVKGWNAKAGAQAAQSGKKLVIKPGVQALRVVSGGGRFFAGALSGESTLTVTMQFVDAASGAVIASPTISKTSNALAGAWSIGATDRNLMNYVAETANQYLILHLNADAPRPGPAPAPEPAPAAPAPAQ